VTKVTNFGVFVELEPGLEGLLHVSELADHKVENPEEIVKPGQELEVKVLRVDADDRKIGLSLKRVQWAAEEEQAEGESAPREEPRLGGIQHVEDEAHGEGSGTTLFGTALPDADADDQPESEPEKKPEEESEKEPQEEPEETKE